MRDCITLIRLLILLKVPFIQLVLLLFVVDSKCDFFIDGTEYYIQNDGDNLCMEASVDNFQHQSKSMGYKYKRPPAIFTEKGYLMTKTCNQSSEEQKWLVRVVKPVNGEKWVNKTFELTSLSISNHFYLKKLNAELAGDVVEFWPNPLLSIEIPHGSSAGNLHMIQDAGVNGTGHCIISKGDGNLIDLDECDVSRGKMRWKYFIISDIQELKDPDKYWPQHNHNN